MNLNQLPWLNKIYNNINYVNLPHGIIINGSLGLGKSILAKEIAYKLIGNSNERHRNLIETNNHPDLLILDKEKILLQHITFRKNKWDDEIGDNNVNDFLSLTSSISDNKVALILNAHTMNNECQNALLKSLEEPSSNSYIIMTTNRKNALLDTIYSRCQVYNIPSLNSIQTDTWLNKNGIFEVNANDFPSFASPLAIYSDIQNDKHLIYKNFLEIVLKYLSNKKNAPETLKSLSDLDVDLIMKVNFFVEFLKITLKSKLLTEDLSGNYASLNDANFSNLKISNLILELNELRFDYFKVPQINETHVLNYFLSELKNSIKIL